MLSSLQRLFDALAAEKGSSETHKDEAKISVHALVGKTGAFYEKIRYLIDNREEHLIRRSAIERIIVRKMFVEGKRAFGLPLVRELVLGGYLPNGEMPERIAADVDAAVER